MLAITHLIIALIIIRALDLDGCSALLTLLFGVFIDLDHLFAVPQFVTEVKAQGIKDIDAAMDLSIQWKSAIHDPSAILLVAPCSMMVRLLAPLLAWIAHIALDSVQIAYLGPASMMEFIFLGFLLMVYLGLERTALEKLKGDEVSVPELINHEFKNVAKWMGGVASFVRGVLHHLFFRGSPHTSQ